MSQNDPKPEPDSDIQNISEIGPTVTEIEKCENTIESNKGVMNEFMKKPSPYAVILCKIDAKVEQIKETFE